MDGSKLHYQDENIWHEFPLRDQCKLMWSMRDQAFAYLDPVSCWVHDSFKKGLDRARIFRLLQEELSLPTSSAELAIANFSESGSPVSVSGTSAADTDYPDSEFVFPFEDYLPTSESLAIVWKTMRIPIGGCQVEVRFYGQAFDTTVVTQAFSHLQGDDDSVEATSTAKYTVNIGCCGSDGLWAQSKATDGYKAKTIEELSTLAYWMLYKTVESSRDWLVALHAGGVTGNDGTLIVTGPSGSGKSTLTIALMREYEHYLSDELIVVSRNEHAIYPVATRPCVKEGSFDAVGQLFPVLETTDAMDRLGKRVKYLPIERSDTEYTKTNDQRSTYIFFPHYQSHCQVEMHAMTTGEIMAGLLDSGSLFGKIETVSQFRDFARWINQLLGFSLRYSSTQQGLDLVSDALAQVR